MTAFPSKSLSDNRKVAPRTAIQKRPRGPKWVGIFAIALTFVFGGVEARAQQPTKVFRIGILAVGSNVTNPARQAAFLQGLRDLGYVDGKNIVVERRWAEGKPDRLPPLATELVRLKVDLIVTAGGISTRFAKEATTTIPIVMTQDIDPVGNGFIASLARPGGNITGLSTFAPEISGKQIELLKEIVPKMVRLTVFGTMTNPGNAQMLRETELAAGVFAVRLQYLDVGDPRDIATVFRAAHKGHADAVLVLPNLVLLAQRAQLAELAAKNRLPAVYGQPEYVDAGGLMFYGASITEMYRSAAVYVDKILKGAQPADLPVEQPKKFEFIVNLKAAKQIGLTIPPNVLARADKVIR